MYGAGIRKLGDGDGMVNGGGTEIRVSIPSHPVHIPFRWECHPNTLPRKALIISNIIQQAHKLLQPGTTDYVCIKLLFRRLKI